MNVQASVRRHCHSPIPRCVAAAMVMLVALVGPACGSPTIVSDAQHAATADNPMFGKAKYAVLTCDWLMLKTLLKDNPDLVFSKDGEGKTLLHFASVPSDGDINVVAELLLANKADVNAKDNSGHTPLFYAAEKERLFGGEDGDFTAELLRYHDCDQATLAKHAVEDTDWKNRLSAVEKLADQTLLAKIATNDKEANVRYAAAGRVRNAHTLSTIADARSNKGGLMSTIVALRKLLDASDILQRPVWISLRVYDTSQVYSSGGNVPASATVYSQTASISIMDGEITALVHNWGTEFPNEVVVSNGVAIPSKIPISPGDVHLKDMLADCWGKDYPPSQVQLAVVKELLKADPHLVCSKTSMGAHPSGGMTPLHCAVASDREDIARLLLADKADINAKDDTGMTPLNYAARGGYKDVVELLLTNKADVNAKNGVGDTPLHYAAGGGYKDIVELLLANKADVNAKNGIGQTPLHDAVIGVYEDVAALLRQSGGHE